MENKEGGHKAGIFSWIKGKLNHLHFEWSALTGSFFSQTGDFLKLKEFLKLNPAMSHKVGEKAIECDKRQPLHSRRIALGLVHCGNAEAVRVFKALLGHRTPGWDAYEEEDIKAIRVFLDSQSEKKLVSEIRRRLPVGKIGGILPEAYEALAKLFKTLICSRKL